MLRFHHVNLGVPEGSLDDESAFLVEVLSYRRVDASRGGPGARWFESDDGKQIHLSEDPDHRPARRAHVAVDLGDDLTAVERRLADLGITFDGADRDGGRVVFCRDPAGNRWELRGEPPA